MKIKYASEELYDRDFKKECYRCGMYYTEPPAFSRHTIPRNIPICSGCGSTEAVKDIQFLEEVETEEDIPLVIELFKKETRWTRKLNLGVEYIIPNSREDFYKFFDVDALLKLHQEKRK